MIRPWKLPPNWQWKAFKDVACVASNLVDPSGYPDHPHLAPNHIIPESGRHEPLETVSSDGVTSSKHLYKPGQIIYSKIRPYLRKATMAQAEGLCSADMYPIETDLESRYLMWWMLSGEFTRLALKGRSVIPKINQRELNALPVPVPPDEEQRAIVEAIERSLSLCAAASAELERGVQRLGVLDDALSHAAVTGRIAGFQGGGNGLWDTPTSWQWREVGGVAEVRGGIQKTPARKPVDNTAPFLRVANVQRNELVLDDVHEVELAPGELDRHRLEEGDLLVVEGNGSLQHIGRCAVWDGSIRDCVHQNHLIRVRPGPDITYEWLNLVWNSPACAEQVRRVAQTTSGLYTLSTKKVASVQLPVPPLDVQQTLTENYKARSTQVRHLDQTIAAAQRRAPALRSSILKAAFEGRLTSDARDAQSLDDLQEATA